MNRATSETAFFLLIFNIHKLGFIQQKIGSENGPLTKISDLKNGPFTKIRDLKTDTKIIYYNVIFHIHSAANESTRK